MSSLLKLIFLWFKLISLVISVVIVSGCGSGSVSTDNGPTLQELGKKIFFDETLSSSNTQSCGSCHDPASGFADPDVSSDNPVSEGSETDSFGDRNAPTAAYAFFIPAFSQDVATTPAPDNTVSNYLGGQFLDGRSQDLTQQAKEPFLNPLEMNNVNTAEVVGKVKTANYANDFIAIFGSGAFDNIDTAYDNIAKAIAAFEASAEVNAFSSKFDDVMAGAASFTASEQRGFNLFKGDKAKCANCHTIPDTDPVLFTNHRFYNIGTPSNSNNPAVIVNSGFIDNGVGDNTMVINAGDASTEAGKFRTPTLRNIALTAPYMHNGVFQTLDQVINHYGLKMQFAFAEVDANLANEIAFDDSSLGLTEVDKTDFMKTLTDQ